MKLTWMNRMFRIKPLSLAELAAGAEIPDPWGFQNPRGLKREVDIQKMEDGTAGGVGRFRGEPEQA